MLQSPVGLIDGQQTFYSTHKSACEAQVIKVLITLEQKNKTFVPSHIGVRGKVSGRSMLS